MEQSQKKNPKKSVACQTNDPRLIRWSQGLGFFPQQEAEQPKSTKSVLDEATVLDSEEEIKIETKKPTGGSSVLSGSAGNERSLKKSCGSEHGKPVPATNSGVEEVRKSPIPSKTRSINIIDSDSEETEVDIKKLIGNSPTLSPSAANQQCVLEELSVPKCQRMRNLPIPSEVPRIAVINLDSEEEIETTPRERSRVVPPFNGSAVGQRSVIGKTSFPKDEKPAPAPANSGIKEKVRKSPIPSKTRSIKIIDSDSEEETEVDTKKLLGESPTLSPSAPNQHCVLEELSVPKCQRIRNLPIPSEVPPIAVINLDSEEEIETTPRERSRVVPPFNGSAAGQRSVIGETSYPKDEKPAPAPANSGIGKKVRNLPIASDAPYVSPRERRKVVPPLDNRSIIKQRPFPENKKCSSTTDNGGLQEKVRTLPIASDAPYVSSRERRKVVPPLDNRTVIKQKPFPENKKCSSTTNNGGLQEKVRKIEEPVHVAASSRRDKLQKNKDDGGSLPSTSTGLRGHGFQASEFNHLRGGLDSDSDSDGDQGVEPTKSILSMRGQDEHRRISDNHDNGYEVPDHNDPSVGKVELPLRSIKIWEKLYGPITVGIRVHRGIIKFKKGFILEKKKCPPDSEFSQELLDALHEDTNKKIDMYGQPFLEDLALLHYLICRPRDLQFFLGHTVAEKIWDLKWPI